MCSAQRLFAARRCINNAIGKDGFSTPELYALCFYFPRQNT
jgi:hypothetical protein